MVKTDADYVPLIESLYKLASAPLEPAAFRRACTSLGRFIKSSSFDDLWYFRAAPRLVLMVSLEVEDTGRRGPLGQALGRPIAVRFAVLSFCWWEKEPQSDDSSADTQGAERAQFDRAFSEALAYATTALGKPLLEGQDSDEQGHRWAIWRGQTALLVLQQSNYDPQFGLDVNFWLCPWSGPDPKPKSPLIDWLTPIS